MQQGSGFAVAKTPDLKWVSHAKDLGWSSSQTRHLLPTRGEAVTTLCGITGLGSGTWRGNTVKPQCGVCMSRMHEIAPNTVSVPGGWDFLKVEGGYTESDSAYTEQELLEQQRAITIEHGDVVAIGSSSHHYRVTSLIKGGGFKATHVDDNRIKLVVYRNELDDVVIVEKSRR